MPDAELVSQLRQQVKAAGLRTEVLAGEQALSDVAAHPDVDMVMASIVGAAGLAPCLAAAKAGKRLLLPTKEAIVVGGQLFIDAVRQGRRHAFAHRQRTPAIFNACLKTVRPGWIESTIVLTVWWPSVSEAPRRSIRSA